MASVERLTKQRKGGSIVTASARDFNDWKRKNGVTPETKVLIAGGNESGLEPRLKVLQCCSTAVLQWSKGGASFFALR